MTDINVKLQQYINLQKEILEFKKKQKENSKILFALEKDIKDYMETNNTDSIPFQDGEIVLYERKINQAFKKRNLTKKLKDTLHIDVDKASEIANTIIKDKVFNVQPRIKLELK